MSEFKKKTDNLHKEVPESVITQALWREMAGIVCNAVGLDVFTHFVESESGIEIKIENRVG